MNTVIFPDTNVILRYLLADHKEMYEKILPFFEDLKKGKKKAVILEGVILETFYVLTKIYSVPQAEAASVLKDLLLYKGIVNKDRQVILEGLNLFLENRGLSLLDCILCARARNQKGKLLTFDKKLSKRCKA